MYLLLKSEQIFQVFQQFSSFDWIHWQKQKKYSVRLFQTVMQSCQFYIKMSLPNKNTDEFCKKKIQKHSLMGLWRAVSDIKKKEKREIHFEIALKKKK